MFIDTHAHIYMKQFDEDIDSVIKNALANKVEKIFLPNVDSTSTERMLNLVDKYPNVCYPMMGLHPCNVKENYLEELAHIKEIKSKHKIYGIGETGIDLYWDKSTKDIQIKSFEQQIQWAIEWKLPIIIHSRNAQELTIELIENNRHPELKGVFHCFGGTLDQAKKIIDLGFYMGIGGVATFKNGGLDKTLPSIDLKHIVLETDAPYLAPAPHRGKRNESSYIPLIAHRIAEIKEMDVDEVMRITSHNASVLYQLI